jgi:hypothetical protein
LVSKDNSGTLSKEFFWWRLYKIKVKPLVADKIKEKNPKMRFVGQFRSVTPHFMIQVRLTCVREPAKMRQTSEKDGIAAKFLINL